MMVCLKDAVVTDDQPERRHRQAEVINNQQHSSGVWSGESSGLTPILAPIAKASVLFTGHLGRK